MTNEHGYPEPFWLELVKNEDGTFTAILTDYDEEAEEYYVDQEFHVDNGFEAIVEQITDVCTETGRDVEFIELHEKALEGFEGGDIVECLTAIAASL